MTSHLLLLPFANVWLPDNLHLLPKADQYRITGKFYLKLQHLPLQGYNHISRVWASFDSLSLISKYITAMTPSYQVAPPRKQWYDKLADAILGDDDPTFASPSARYALICEKCFNHNGLVKESMWEDARKFLSWNLSIQSLNSVLEYVCPKCGHFNASVRAKKTRPRQSLSPTPSPSQSPQGHPQPVSSPTSRMLNESDRDLPTVDGPEPTPMEVDPAEGASPP